MAMVQRENVLLKPKVCKAVCWQFFNFTLGQDGKIDERNVTCTFKLKDKEGNETVCGFKCDRGASQNKANWTTAKMTRHCEKDHRAAYEEILANKKKIEKEKLEQEKNSSIETYYPKVMNPSSKRKRVDDNEMNQVCDLIDGVALSQSTLQNCIDRKKPWTRGDIRSKKIDYLIGQMIGTDKLPLNFVNGYGFQHVINHIEPRYEIPGRTYMTNNVIPSIYEHCKENLMIMQLISAWILIYGLIPLIKVLYR